MGVVVRDTSKAFDPAPEGTFSAVCVDVIDKGNIETHFGTRHVVQVRWQLGEDAGWRDDGKPWLLLKDYTASLNEKATLRRDLESWRGKRFTSQELEGFDLDRILGAACLVQVLHNLSENGRTYANIQTIMPLPKGLERPEPREYVRVSERQEPAEESGEEF